MERRLLVVFALTFLVIMLFQPLLKKYGPQPPAKPEGSQAVQNQAQLPSQSPTQPLAHISQPATKTGQAPSLQATGESETVVENDVYRIVFTNRGGRVKSWVLKKYTDDKGGQLELVNASAAEKYGYPLTLWSYDEGLRDKLNAALYVSSEIPVPGSQSAGDAPKPIKFVFSDGDVSVEKTFAFDRSSYVVDVKTAVHQKGVQVTAFPMWPGGFGADQTGPSMRLDRSSIRTTIRLSGWRSRRSAAAGRCRDHSTGRECRTSILRRCFW